MDLTQKNDLPAFARDRLIEHDPFAMAKDFLLDPLTSELPANPKGNCRAHDIADQDQKKSPPKSEKKSASDRQHAARQQQQIAGREQQRIEDRAPPFHLPDLALRALDYVNEIEMLREPRNENDEQ